MEYCFIDNSNLLEKESRHWNVDLGIDLECENSLHHYGVYITLIQISSKDRNWIVDVLSLDHIDPLKKVMENPDTQTIFHDVSFDLRILNKQFGIKPKNVFDTQIAAHLVGMNNLGLGSLLEHFFSIKTEKKFQMVDWTKRPLTKAMLTYAVKDSMYLLKLRDMLHDLLKKKGRLEWARQEFKNIEHRDLTYKDVTYADVRGYNMMTPRQRAIFKRIYNVREKLAKKVDMPVHFIINTKILKQIAKEPPKSFKEWKSMNRVHPIVRRKAGLFFEEVNKGKNEELKIEQKRRKYYSEKQKMMLNELEEARAAASKDLNLERHLILSKDQIHEIVRSGNYDSLRPWQKDKLMEYFKVS